MCVQTYRSVCCFLRGNGCLCVAFFYWLICVGMKGSQQIFKGGGGGKLLKINWNNEARGSWIISFCVLENVVPCTYSLLYLFMFEK